MFEITADYTQGVAFRAKTRGHEIVSDQPLEGGGDDQGLTPPELLLASLATCAGYYALQYLRTRSLPTDGLSVRVTAEKSRTHPARLENFRIEVNAAVREEFRQGLLRSVDACLIHKTLTDAARCPIEIVLCEPVTVEN